MLDMAVDTSKMTRKLISLPNDMLETISDFRFRERIGSEAEAIRRLIEAGLRASINQNDESA